MMLRANLFRSISWIISRLSMRNWDSLRDRRAARQLRDALCVAHANQAPTLVRAVWKGSGIQVRGVPAQLVKIATFGAAMSSACRQRLDAARRMDCSNYMLRGFTDDKLDLLAGPGLCRQRDVGGMQDPNDGIPAGDRVICEK
jgi:hypothetical protein